MRNLTPEKAFIFRIIHIDNMGTALQHGLLSRTLAETVGPYTDIGNLQLIEKRKTREIEVTPFGTLSDYVPFYFTPRSPMAYNIKTGYGVPAKQNSEIVIAVGSLHKLQRTGKSFLFSDRHAYMRTASFSNDLGNLNILPWNLWQTSDFKYDSEHPDKLDRYQAEALIHEKMEIEHLLGFGCSCSATKESVEGMLAEAGLAIDVKLTPGWYFQ